MNNVLNKDQKQLMHAIDIGDIGLVKQLVSNGYDHLTKGTTIAIKSGTGRKMNTQQEKKPHNPALQPSDLAQAIFGLTLNASPAGFS